MSGPECCSNPPVLNPNAGAGHVEKLGGLNSYLSGSPNSIAIFLISDIYGLVPYDDKINVYFLGPNLCFLGCNNYID
ncbi:hypothetical protein D0Y65_026733 [Glycine soja]|uniref:Uncharacterized protein n=1 Tax=Glycine soja TaxID=3848 RepID=A0A445IL21_GLYSO|nr:hypothetical protein JHK87_027667 [Glycine soja]RZB86767.1 hypothetical protein D0Y65_026733 [Glycine soja]